jgi:hypothetical protein
MTFIYKLVLADGTRADRPRSTPPYRRGAWVTRSRLGETRRSASSRPGRGLNRTIRCSWSRSDKRKVRGSGCFSIAPGTATIEGAMGDQPRGTVTFLFTDIAGSTELVRRLGTRYADTLGEHPASACLIRRP